MNLCRAFAGMLQRLIVRSVRRLSIMRFVCCGSVGGER